MIFIQHINIRYDKNMRYANYANIRRSIKFCPLKHNGDIEGEILYNRVIIDQWSHTQGNSIHHTFNKTYFSNNFSCSGWAMTSDTYGRTNVVKAENAVYDIYYNYNHVPYVSKIFTLKSGEYGRLIYNERCVDIEGTWWYEFHTLNFVNAPSSAFKEKIFYRKNPDYIIEDMKTLRYYSNA